MTHFARRSSPSSLKAVFSDAVSPAICMNEGCDFTCEMEPDQDAGYCEECHTNTMKAAPASRQQPDLAGNSFAALSFYT
jgi:hypothetical protein